MLVFVKRLGVKFWDAVAEAVLVTLLIGASDIDPELIDICYGPVLTNEPERPVVLVATNFGLVATISPHNSI